MYKVLTWGKYFLLYYIVPCNNVLPLTLKRIPFFVDILSNFMIFFHDFFF